MRLPPSLRPRGFTQAFTLIELLVVTAIVALLASILFPVFALARENARRSQCLSNERQIGLAVLAYGQDNDERFPNGISPRDGRPFWAGEGWAGQCAPFLHAAVFRCPDDPTVPLGARDQPVSYGYNINLVEGTGFFRALPPAGRKLAALTAPAQTVTLFEVSGVTVNLTEPDEGSGPDGAPGRNFSASGTGLDNRLYAQKTASTRAENQYATGYLGSRPPDPPSQFRQAAGRHSGGSNFLLADGHAAWLRGERVSSGINALGEKCGQDNAPPRDGCSEDADDDRYLSAAGTGISAYHATFSIK